MTEVTIPSTREELDRKTIETMNEFTLNYEEKGFLSQESYYHGLRALHLVTCGLIDQEVSDFLSEHLSKADVSEAVERRVFVGGGATIVMQRKWVGDSFDMIKIVDGKQASTTKSFADADSPHVACYTAFSKFLAQLVAKGFVEVGDE